MINDRGQVVGLADTKATKVGFPVQHVFLWQDGKMRDLGVESSSPPMLNDRGQVLIDAQPWADLQGLWDRGRLRVIGRALNVNDVNDRGQVVGAANPDKSGGPITHAFVWEGGNLTDLGTLPGGKESWALAINNRGQIIGYSDTKGGNQHAVLWTLRD